MFSEDFWKNQYHSDSFVFRMFGLKKQEIDAKIRKHFPELKISVSVKNLDARVSIGAIPDFDSFRRIVTDIFAEFDPYIYADDDTGLNERVFGYLELLDKRLGIAESVTGGKVADSLIRLSGASRRVYEGIVAYSNDAKIFRLHVNPVTLDKYSAVSREVAEEMVSGLLLSPYNDVAVSTTGYATADESYMTKGLVYIGVGNAQQIVTERFVFEGDREEVRSTAANAALFMLIKLLRANFDASEMKKE